jgi:hypothetical protein
MPSPEHPVRSIGPENSPDPLDALLARAGDAPKDPWFASRVLARVRSEKSRTAPRLRAILDFWRQHPATRPVVIATLATALLVLGIALPSLPGPGGEDPLSLAQPAGPATQPATSLEWSDEELFEDLDILLADYQQEAWLALDSTSLN